MGHFKHFLTFQNKILAFQNFIFSFKKMVPFFTISKLNFGKKYYLIRSCLPWETKKEINIGGRKRNFRKLREKLVKGKDHPP